MIVLGIDPGKTTGWATYCTDDRRVLAAGTFPDWQVDIPSMHVNAVVIERPKGQGPTFPDVVEAGIAFGWLLRWAEQKWSRLAWLYRYDVKRILRDATLGEVNPTNDATVWAALKLLHGEGCDRKPSKKCPEGGAIGRDKSHERAALAVAVACAHREGVLSC
jgi:hypothetical protein